MVAALRGGFLFCGVIKMPTVKVMPSSPSQGDYVVIEESDFEGEIHELYVEPNEAAPEKENKNKK